MNNTKLKLVQKLIRTESVRHSAAKFIPEPCRFSDSSEIRQGSGKKPDNDGVLQVLQHHNNQQSEAG